MGTSLGSGLRNPVEHCRGVGGQHFKGTNEERLLRGGIFEGEHAVIPEGKMQPGIVHDEAGEWNA
jgi:hypothetical protein